MHLYVSSCLTVATSNGTPCCDTLILFGAKGVSRGLGSRICSGCIFPECFTIPYGVPGAWRWGSFLLLPHPCERKKERGRITFQTDVEAHAKWRREGFEAMFVTQKGGKDGLCKTPIGHFGVMQTPDSKTPILTPIVPAVSL